MNNKWMTKIENISSNENYNFYINALTSKLNLFVKYSTIAYPLYLFSSDDDYMRKCMILLRTFYSD